MELYLLSPPEQPFLGLLPDVLDAGVDRFQYRRPGLDDLTLSREVQTARRICRDRSVPLMVNNRVDLAALHEVDGVHLGQDDLPVSEVKEQWPGLTVGRTLRVDEPAVPGADHFSLGPVFSPGSKTLDVKPCGIDGIGRVLDRIEQPLYVIGGLRPEHAFELPRALQGVAVVSSVWDERDPVRAVTAWRDALDVRST